MNNKPCFVNICLHIIGLLLCILPPALATASYFPLWINRGAESTIAGGGVLILVLCAAPLWKAVLRLLRSPSSHVIWLLLFGLFLFRLFFRIFLRNGFDGRRNDCRRLRL